MITVRGVAMMSNLVTTKQLISMLQEQDPIGDKVVSFRIVCEDNKSEFLASGEVDEKDINIVQKFAAQTIEGDRDLLRITVPLECAE